MSSAAYRRVFALIFGALTGLCYGLVSQFINSVFMPGIPFYQPPFGGPGNILFAISLGMVLGLIDAWPESDFTGVLLSSLSGAAVISIATLVTGQPDATLMASRLTSLSFIFMPIAAILAPVLILFRWIISREVNAFRETQAGYKTSPLARAGLPILLLLIASAAGLTSLYNDLGRAVIPRMDALLESAQASQDEAALPTALRSPDVAQFIEKGRGPYSLDWEKDDEYHYRIPRPLTSRFDQSVVIAYYDNGYILACLFPSKTADPKCRDHDF